MTVQRYNKFLDSPNLFAIFAKFSRNLHLKPAIMSLFDELAFKGGYTTKHRKK